MRGRPKNFLLQVVPLGLRAKLIARPELHAIFANTGWLFFDRLIRMGVGLFVGVWLARYLGPEQFGLFNFAIAFVAIFGALASLGLDGIVVRDLVRDRTRAHEVIGTSFFLQLVGGLIAVLLVVGTIGYLRSEVLVKTIVAILSITLVFKATGVVKFWFEARVQSKYPVWVESGVFLGISGVKIVMILREAPLIAFVWVALIEVALTAAALLLIYISRGGALQSWKPRIARARSLLKDSWPLTLSGLAVMMYMRIDQIMLAKMVGDEAVGIYTAAVRVSEVWYFIPMAIVASVFPAIVEAKEKSQVLYEERLQRLYNLMVWLAVGVALPMTFLSDWLVNILFGRAYAEAGTVLAIHIWTGVFVFLGVASGKWFLVENMQMLAFQRVLFGLAVNVILNFILIPLYGVVGAALATLVSQMSAALLFDAVQEKTRPVFRMKMKAFMIFKGRDV